MRIVLVGTGNLATRLGIALLSTDAQLVQVFGRSETNTAQLAHILHCPHTICKKYLCTDADLYILAVSDDSILSVVSSLPIQDKLVVHTAGSVSLDILASASKNYGVFYPLQTFSKYKEVDFKTIPVCIEANNNVSLELLNSLAMSLSDKVFRVDSYQREQLHLAAVFVCNFVNHFYSIGEKLLNEHQLDYDLLKPLILETANKAMLFSPPDVQTGPAIRGSKTIMTQHLKMLVGHPEWQKMYEMVSTDIDVNRRGDPMWSSEAVKPED